MSTDELGKTLYEIDVIIISEKVTSENCEKLFELLNNANKIVNDMKSELSNFRAENKVRPSLKQTKNLTNLALALKSEPQLVIDFYKELMMMKESTNSKNVTDITDEFNKL